MSEQRFRNTAGGVVDRERLVQFDFNGRTLDAYAGDTVASALLAHGLHLVGRSFKYHRPRGIMGSWSEEPNALVRIRDDGITRPNIKATQVMVHDGLEVESQNHWPSLAFDLGAVAGMFSDFLPAGFYYKTFMWPHSAWLFYERLIRRAAGLGRVEPEPDSRDYAKRFDFCDVLIVGAGPSGLMAAKSAAESGLEIMVVDDRSGVGGHARGELVYGDDGSIGDWLSGVGEALRSHANVRLLTQSTAFGIYDDGLVGVLEQVDATGGPGTVRDRLRLVRAKRIVLCTGAIERPMVFPGNDCPGVMLGSAVQAYANQYAVRAGERGVVFTNNASGYRVAYDMARAGIDVRAVVDSRLDGATSQWRERLHAFGIELLSGYVVSKTSGRSRVAGVELTNLTADGSSTFGSERHISCDLVASCGGWNPSAHLFAHRRADLDWDETIQAYRPSKRSTAEGHPQVAGAVDGEFGLNAALASGQRLGQKVASELGGTSPVTKELPRFETDESYATHPFWCVPITGRNAAKMFVDHQNDVTVRDLALAESEGYRSVEHIKRYTTLGMGTDQGRTSNVNAIGIMARARGVPVPEVGYTTFRPPYSPVPLGAFAADGREERLRPVRRTPMHDWHVNAGARMIEVGLWMRPQYYPRANESPADAYYREATEVRRQVGIVDVSTLGKIEIEGTGAAAFLERVYANRWANLAIGRCRYGIMLRDDGMVFDDGTTSRLNENRFYMTTTTGEAAHVMSHLEYHAQISWPELDVKLTSVTDQWAAIALAGPNSREVLAALMGRQAVSNDAFKYMDCTEQDLDGIPARIFRITFSGELGYELHVPADFGLSLWERLLEVGAPHGMAPYGTEAMGILRIEKGHVVASELDGRTTADDVGLGRMLRADGQYIGSRLRLRPGLTDERRKQLVGLVAEPSTDPVPGGAQLIDRANRERALNDSVREVIPYHGHVTSHTFSPALDSHIALALLENGRQRLGERLVAVSPVRGLATEVRVVEPVFFDPDGERARG